MFVNWKLHQKRQLYVTRVKQPELTSKMMSIVMVVVNTLIINYVSKHSMNNSQITRFGHYIRLVTKIFKRQFYEDRNCLIKLESWILINVAKRLKIVFICHCHQPESSFKAAKTATTWISFQWRERSDFSWYGNFCALLDVHNAQIAIWFRALEIGIVDIDFQNRIAYQSYHHSPAIE